MTRRERWANLSGRGAAIASCALLIAAVPSREPPINVVGHAWAPFISPMGEPFRARNQTDDTLARWFEQADRNHDGALTLDEMEADAARFFATLDTDGDRQIDPDELIHYEWELAPDVQVNARLRRTAQEAAADPKPQKSKDRRRGEADFNWMNQGLQGAARYGLLNMPEPVAAADFDFNRAITAGEFQQAADERFKLLDSAKQERLTLADLQSMRTAVLAKLKQRKFKKDDPDARIGSSLPLER